jgi:hypothetical protein
MRDYQTTGWQNEANSSSLVPMFTKDFTPFLDSIWREGHEAHRDGFRIIDRPAAAYVPDGPDFTIYRDPILDCATNSDEDALRILRRIQADYIDGGIHSYKACFVVGDQQTYDRVTTNLLAHPQQLSWAIMLSGDFHFLCHVVACFHVLWWATFGCWAVKHFGNEKEIKPPGQSDNIAEWKHYDRWYLLLTLAIMRLLHEVCPDLALREPAILLEFCKNNAGESLYFKSE